MTKSPLPLPENFNPDTLMIKKETELGLFHEVRRAAQHALELVENGTPDDIELAERILARVLECQELDPHDPHVGNFYWMAEDDFVQDLNAVEFVLERLIPMMLRFGERLSAPMQERVLATVRLGLAEIARLDVLVAYTNITALDILNTCLGGELLDEPAIRARGYQKLVAWIAYTNLHGHPLEHNSPTYTSVTLRALKRLCDMVQDGPTRQRAEALAARLAISVALHIHSTTGRWAGPHSRAYHPSVVGETPSEVALLQGWIADGTVPAWIGALLDERPAAYSVMETAERSRPLVLTTHLTDAYALGTATQKFHPQSNACIVHYNRPASERPGVMYTRFVLNDKWFGDSYHATDRTSTRNLLDEGDFLSVQHENRAIALYSMLDPGVIGSAKTMFIWTRRAEIDEIWVGGQRVTELPHSVPAGETVVVGSGDTFIAVQPLHITPLSRGRTVQLVEKDNDLVLEVYLYRGAEKSFWELRWPGAFYQGRPFCACYLEVATREDYADGAAFAANIAAGTLSEEVDAPFTYPAAGERHYRASYARNGVEVGLDVELMTWQLQRRWTESGSLNAPLLDSPLVKQSDGAEVQVDDVCLTCTTPETQDGPIWLCVLPQSGQTIVGYLGTQPITLTLEHKGGRTEKEVIEMDGAGVKEL